MSYTYLWLEGSQPRYVGKGTGSRAGQHLADKSWAKDKNLECRVFDCGRDSLLAESLLIQLLGSFGLENKAIPGAFNPYRNKPLPHEVMHAAWATMERVGHPPAFRESLRFAELIHDSSSIAPVTYPDLDLLRYLNWVEELDPQKARMTAWVWLSVYGGDFEEVTKAANKYLFGWEE